MKRLWSLSIVIIFLGLATAAAAAPAPPPLYHQVAGGEEECEYTGKPPITILAAEKGVKATVVIRQNRIKGQRIKKGQVLKINTSHIVPAELDNGFVINLPELLLYHFCNGTYQRRYTLAIGKPSWPTPTGTYKIIDKRKNPTWNVPPSIQEEMEDQGLEVVEKVPPGPKNPLGKYFMLTSAEGVGIHATNRPWSCGLLCLPWLPAHAAQEIPQLFPQITVGTPVKIIYRPIKLAVTPEGRIYLEVHPDIYGTGTSSPWNTLRTWPVISTHRPDRLGLRCRPILKAKEGIAQEITKGPPVPLPTAPPADSGGPKEVRLSPLQVPKPTVE